ncbi:hypothetical protein BC835DRAFT_1303464 [Cytidiella melzeri]|nr:hypothetical protein BC835DRAFT_1303464 [Cytidiella melzeri]
MSHLLPPAPPLPSLLSFSPPPQRAPANIPATHRALPLPEWHLQDDFTEVLSLVSEVCNLVATIDEPGHLWTEEWQDTLGGQTQNVLEWHETDDRTCRAGYTSHAASLLPTTKGSLSNVFTFVELLEPLDDEVQHVCTDGFYEGVDREWFYTRQCLQVTGTGTCQACGADEGMRIPSIIR